MVNESKNMYIPEDTLENHQGNFSICLPSVWKLCVCAIWMCLGGVWWVCWHYHGHDAGVYPNLSIFKHTMRTEIAFGGRSTNVMKYNHSCPTDILLLFWREMRTCSWWTCWLARSAAYEHATAWSCIMWSQTRTQMSIDYPVSCFRFKMAF